ncbi:MAG: cobalamin biosynthesis protein CbiD [Clostridiales bacterium]|uniref:cobalt-precorrin-5B (C(1))-methyltransferase CbiD n=1 Tax=Provencibacterium massiliense TaxID=1841868 RepID=UPI0009A8203C|nr:cobalt-precorrin-5B (C(1))-methyltransferase CbiD [Provencibacterium massiliense]PWM37167.1 MAG: cobalamin biosynthesis protein CbiD [Clostridiales bacterium]RGB70025.1 cobalamin biosynthesis protein CbiD [Harryflintia acetispora]
MPVKELRHGYTTGTCAAAAAKAAALLLLTGEASAEICLPLPGGGQVILPVCSAVLEDQSAGCAVRKDSGDDPDVTDGVLVFAEVSRIPTGFTVDGGEGIGRVTKAGLSCPVGSAAINPVPRQMITRSLEEAAGKADYRGGLAAIISIPGGEALAHRTYNPRLGIEGGLSILGTSGIVEPMSERALIDTIHVEMDVLRAAGVRTLILTPGNYGETFLREKLGFDLGRAVKCSNFVGEALDYAVQLGFAGILLVGHMGKLCKLAGGIMNTHSHVADARMELIGVHAALCGAGREVVEKIMDSLTTDEAVRILDEAEIKDEALRSLTGRVEYHLKARVGEDIPTGAILFSNRYGVLGRTALADALCRQIRREERA